ncbi:SLBB domain-containing protein [Salinisphaera aquimarina]|uniref:SLBB domain-containing protein n=1 Tax=Salinisphaera aquimarina TaxID=2094031 RepID=A0ABV7ESW4_9GAMM
MPAAQGMAGARDDLRLLRLSQAPPGNRATARSAAPTTTAPRDTDVFSGIVLGEGDVIEFRMFGQPDMTTTGYISANGDVSLPLLQQFSVGGLTPNEAQTKIEAAYREAGYFNDPQVSITIPQYRSQQISVLGEVRQPGRYPLQTRTSVLDALAEAEGITPQGAERIVVIRRTASGSRRYRLQLDQLVAGTEAANGFDLAGGDTVFVPQAPLFYIYGEVRRPDAYAIRPGMTVMQAISTGGGLTDRGSNSRIVIQRKANGSSRSLNPALTDTIQPDDVIFVKERFF